MAGTDPSIPIARPLLGPEELAALQGVLESRWVGQGPLVELLEQRLAAQVQVAEAVAVSSGTAALHLALLACGLGPGDRVAVPSFTFVASANAVLLAGAEPLLVDCDPVTFNMDVDDLQRRARRAGGVQAILPVHQFGLPCDMAGVAAVAREWGALVIEDAACALGARLGEQPAGSMGLAGCLSFHPRKIVTTGEGGAVLTRDPSVAGLVRSLRSHGIDPSRDAAGGMPDVVRPGFNYRLSDLQAALGLVQLERLPAMQARRAALAARYRDEVGDLPWLVLPAQPPGVTHGWQSFVVLLKAGDLDAGHARRETLRQGLARRGIATRPGTHAVHALTLYRERYGHQPEDLPGAWAADRLSLALPLYPEMTEEDVVRVAQALREGGTGW